VFFAETFPVSLHPSLKNKLVRQPKYFPTESLPGYFGMCYCNY